ncbi:MAG TPA: porin, partial [Permianibacter sp.]|nr:porin [Permianibacter sp.]
LKLAQGKVDQFNDLEFADMKFIFNGEVRANNTISYSSPKIADGLVFNIASLLQEKVDTDASSTDDDQDGLFDVLSYSVEWQGKDLFASVSVMDNYGLDTAQKDIYQDGGKTTRAVATYKIGPVQLGAMWQEYEEQTGTDSNGDGEISDTDGMLLSVAYTFAEKHTLKLQHGQSDIKLDGGEQNYFGYDYKAAKNVTLFAVVGDQSQDADDKDKSYLAGGLKVVF